MKKLGFAMLVEQMEKVKEVAGRIQQECIKEQPDMMKVIWLLVLLEPIGRIWQLAQTAKKSMKGRRGRRIRRGRRSKSVRRK